MKVRIHHGAHEIGGNCVEVEHDGARLVLDVGRPLTAQGDVVPLPDIAGLSEDGDDSVLGVLISHHHQDHWGLVDQVRAGLPIFMGAATERILRAAAFWTRGLDVPVAGHLEHRVPFSLGPFTITPYLNDHSAFDAYSLLVDAGGERLFYTGDIRGHGRKAGIFEQLLDRPPSGVDTLLMEGTNLQPGLAPKPVMPESAVEQAMAATFRETDGLGLVVTSAQNIDRLVTIYRAAKQSGRQLVMDAYSADIARATDRETIPRPHPDWQLIHTYLPIWQARRIKDAEAFDRLDGVDGINDYRLYPEDLAADPARYVLLFSAGDGHRIAKAGALEAATCIYSLWSGYLEEPSGVRLRGFLDDHDIPLVHHHTSGHASVDDLQRLAGAIDATQVVPIHTFGGTSLTEFVDRVQPKDDGEWWDAAPRAIRGDLERPGYNTRMYVAYREGLHERAPTVVGALVRTGSESAEWVEGYEDSDDSKDAAAAWEYYDEGYGVSQARGVLGFRLRSIADAADVVTDVEAELVEAHKTQRQQRDPELPGKIEATSGASEGRAELNVDDEIDWDIPRLDVVSIHDALAVSPGVDQTFGGVAVQAIAVPQVDRIISEPTAGHWFPQVPRGEDWDGVRRGAAYYGALLHLLLFRLGWVYPSRGLHEWRSTGMVDWEAHLSFLRRIDDEVDLDPFHAWLHKARGSFEQVLQAVGRDPDGMPDALDDSWAAEVVRREEAAGGATSPVVGGTDPLHLGNIPMAAANHASGRAEVFVSDIGQSQGVLLLDTLDGWYSALHSTPQLLAHEAAVPDAVWAWEVLIRGMGSLGVFRQDHSTGIRHATTDRVHRWGVFPPGASRVVLD